MAATQHPSRGATDLWQRIDASLSAAMGEAFSTRRRIPVSGGCINDTLRLEGRRCSVFLKLGGAEDAAMFEAEAESLKAIAATHTLRVPAVITRGEGAGRTWLAMEYITRGRAGPDAAARLGEQLAALHAVTGPHFGWHRDNWIGATPQHNTPAQGWPDFFAAHRLGAQLAMARGNGLARTTVDAGFRLAEALPAVFQDYTPRPALLHGDLWGGNWACDHNGQPYVFDPASYFGDRDADIAMTELFGGFPDSFYHAYDAVLPRAPGYPVRRQLYNLYHVLNHFNLFGGGYGVQAGAMIDRLLADIGA